MKTINHSFNQQSLNTRNCNLNPTIPSNSIIQGHILKFIKKGKSHIDRGVICYPQQTYGTSQQSPIQFKSSFGLIPKNGYIYKYQNKNQFKYFSQKRYFSIDGSTDQTQSAIIHLGDQHKNTLDIKQKNKEDNLADLFKFHKKKGRLTEFIDKNSWMNKTIKMHGFERNDIARELQRTERKKRIDSLKPRIQYNNKQAYRPDTSCQYFKTIGSLACKKMKIRLQRNNHAQRFSQSIQPRNINTSRRVPSKLQKEYIQERMLNTARDFSPSRQTKTKLQNFGRKTFNNSKNRVYKFEKDMEKNNQHKEYSWRQNHQQTLQDWYRTTCSSKWVYRKKIDSQEEDEVRDHYSERRGD